MRMRHLATLTFTLIANAFGPGHDAAAAAAAASSAALEAAAPANLLQNGDFATGLSGWSRAESVAWTPFGSSAAGSAKVTQRDEVSGKDVLVQCVPVEGGRLYDLSASAFLPHDPYGTGGVGIRVRWYGEGACKGPALRGTPSLDFSQVAPPAWQRKEVRITPAPFGTQSALILAVARADAPEGYTLFVDDLRLARTVDTETLTLPAAASVTGAFGQRFVTDLFLHNPAPADRTFILKLHQAGRSGEPTPILFHIGARETRVMADVIQETYGSDRAGAIEIDYDPRGGPLQVYARAATTQGNGMGLPVLPREGARSSASFLGFRGENQRVNVGAFNPTDANVEVRFELRDAAGIPLGLVTRVWGPREWFQINDLVRETGVTAVPFSVVFDATQPVFPFVISIDNGTGDPTFLPALDLVSIP